MRDRAISQGQNIGLQTRYDTEAKSDGIDLLLFSPLFWGETLPSAQSSGIA